MEPMVYIRDATEKAILAQDPVPIKTTPLWKAIETACLNISPGDFCQRRLLHLTELKKYSKRYLEISHDFLVFHCKLYSSKNADAS